MTKYERSAKFHRIVRERGLTREQVAACLGCSARRVRHIMIDPESEHHRHPRSEELRLLELVAEHSWMPPVRRVDDGGQDNA